MYSETGSRKWATSRIAFVAGMALAATMLAASLQLFVQDRQLAVKAQLARNELYARVLEDQVTRAIDTAALSLATIGNELAEQGVAGTSAVALGQVLASLPQLRSVAILDLQGRVLASSSAADVGLRIDLARVGPLPVEGRDVLGPHVPGRSLADIARGAAAPLAPAAVGFIPLLRRVKGQGGEYLLAGLVHPEGMANHMRLTINDASIRVTLLDYDGRLYSDTADGVSESAIHRHTVFRDFLPRIEHASYIGAGVGEGRQTGAFRVSSTRPLVILVERPFASVIDEWFHDVWRQMLVVAMAVVAVAAFTWTAARSMAARERTRRSLDHAQYKIARSEQELSVIVRSVQELLFRLDVEGSLTFVNAHWAAASALPATEMIGVRLESFVAEEEREQVRAMLRPGGQAGVRTATVTLWPERDRARRFDMALVALQDGSAVTGFAGSAVDITERERAQALMADQLAFIGLLQDLSPLPTYMLDTTGCYVNVNKAWQAFTGQHRAEMLGRRAYESLTEEEAREHERQDRWVLARGGLTQYETVFAHPDGSRRDLLVNKVLVPGGDGRAQGILCTFMDVTALRNASRATQEARDAAEEASRSKSEFIANISHELRTPLQSIIGFSELGAGRARADVLLQGMFSDILAAGHRMLALVNDLLDVAKIESAVGTIHLERTDLRPLLRSVLQELAPLLAAKRLAVEMHLPSSALVAKVDPVRFQQVIRNVAANAIKFAPPGAPIVVDAAVEASGAVHVSVRDHGPGIPPDELDDIFDAFVQSSSTKDGSGGTGLGLAICRKIMAAHGGDIYAENAVDGGSRFHVVLPPRNTADTVPGQLAA